MKNEIINILKTKYNIDTDIENRVDQLLECMNDDNVFNTLDQILDWYDNKLKNIKAKVTPVDLNQCYEWEVDKKTGNFEHKSKGYFKIIGVKTDTNVRESGKGWIQPMIDQGTEASIVGLIKKKFNGIPHYLIDAKFEPGNYGKIQFSPTLQCTYDNLNTIHNGSKPAYSLYFENKFKEKNILFEHWYPEDGGRFYLKRVKNMIIEIDSDITAYPSHIWMTMYQLKKLLKMDDLVNAHLRSLISYL
jgi:oxidase EvaA